ncbi:MAG: response regulator [Lautropia sp.]
MGERARTILVVDDTTASRYATSRILRAAGFKVLEAATGREGVDQADAVPDAIVLDVNLPDIDGFEVVRILKLRPRTAAIPIIHLSASFVDSADLVHGLNQGADGYLTHPVEGPVLVATLSAFIRARSAEERLRRSEATFRAIFEMALSGIALIGDDLRFRKVNDALGALLGRPAASFDGACWLDLVLPEERAAAQSFWNEARRSGTGVGTYRMRDAAQSVLALDWHVSRHVDPGVWLALVIDRTGERAVSAERARLLDAERAARAQAERASRTKDEFLATVSHELRSPLQAILGGVQLLRHRFPNLAPDERLPFDLVERNARRLTQLIEDLLDISRVTSGKLRLELEHVDLRQVAAESVAGIDAAAADASIVLQLQDCASPLPVQADPLRLTQIFQNLLSNAIKFTPRGGTVKLTLARDGDCALVCIQDTGRGIGSEFLPHIFEQFRQEDGGNTRQVGGLGLGLSIVKRLTELHGGTVTAHSDGKQKGSTFVLRLPLDEQAFAAAAPPSDEADAPSLDGLTVLIVDDDADCRVAVSRMLGERGASIIEAKGAVQALDLLEVARVDLIVSDIGMPDVDGYALIRQVRARGHSAQALPAIALTAFARGEDRASATQAGFQQHLPKPIRSDALLAAIARLAGR